MSVAGPHSDWTVPVRTERIQRRGDFWWWSIPGCQPKLSTGRLRAENEIVEVTGCKLENGFFSCRGCCMANSLNSYEGARVWSVMCDFSFTLSIPGKLLKTWHTDISFTVNSEFQCHHLDAEENHPIAYFTIRLCRCFCFK